MRKPSPGDAFFQKAFGDDQSTAVGTGWISGVSSVFFGMLGLGGVLCLRFPQMLTLPDARAHYPVLFMRLFIQGLISAALMSGAISAILRERKVLGLTGAGLALLAALFGGGAAPLPAEIGTRFGIGFDWFLLDLFVMTIVFVPVERIWARHPDQGTFRPEWTTDGSYFIATHLPAQILTLTMVMPATIVVRHVAIPGLAPFVNSLPFVAQLAAAIVVADLAQYFVHRGFHQIPLLWRFHSIHHSIQTMDWLAGSRSHFVDIVLTRGLIMIPLQLCGFSQAVLAGYLIFVSFHATWSHTDFAPRFPWLEPWFVTARYHHWHHAAHPEACDVNFAIHFPIIDKAFGTLHFPKDAWPRRYGLINGKVPEGMFAQWAYPFTGR